MFSKGEERKLKHEFWEGFDRYTRFFSKKVNEPIKWMLYKTGIKGLEFKFCTEKKLIQVMLEVNHRNENRRFDIYVELHKYKNILEVGIEGGLIWIDDLQVGERKIVSRLFVETNEYNFNRREDWPEIYKFMAINMYQLQSNFQDIQDILKEKLGVN